MRSNFIHWLIYNDNDLIVYDNRTLLERFPIPNKRDRDNVFVKSVVRGNLNKTIFYPNTSNHVPSENLTICNSIGEIINNYNSYSVWKIVHKYGYLKHFTTKTVEEYCAKIKRGRPRGKKYAIPDRVKLFFRHNNFTKAKLKFFEKTLNMSFRINKPLKNKRFYERLKANNILLKESSHKRLIYHNILQKKRLKKRFEANKILPKKKFSKRFKYKKKKFKY